MPSSFGGEGPALVAQYEEEQERMKQVLHEIIQRMSAAGMPKKEVR
jgi:integrase